MSAFDPRTVDRLLVEAAGVLLVALTGHLGGVLSGVSGS
jgi:hypothetical protein